MGPVCGEGVPDSPGRVVSDGAGGVALVANAVSHNPSRSVNRSRAPDRGRSRLRTRWAEKCWYPLIAAAAPTNSCGTAIDGGCITRSGSRRTTITVAAVEKIPQRVWTVCVDSVGICACNADGRGRDRL